MQILIFISTIENKLHKEFLNACKRFKIEQLQEEQLLKLLPISNWNEISEEVEKSNLILSHKFLNIFLLKAIEVSEFCLY